MMWDKVIKTLAACAGIVAGLFGGFDAMMQVLVACMVIDYLTGLVVAWDGALTQDRNRAPGQQDRILRPAEKALILLVVFLAVRLDSVLPTDQAVFRSMMCWFYIANEGISILENLALAGVPFPGALKTALEQLQKKADPPDLPKLEEDGRQ